MAFVTGNERYGLLLENVEGASKKPATINKEVVAKLLLAHKKEQLLNCWINGLRLKASITIHEGKP